MEDLQYSQGDAAFLRMVHHEAGHTLVMCALCVGVEYVCVVQLDRMTAPFEQECPGGSESKPVAGEFKSASWTDRCLIKRAGEVAERRHAKAAGIVPEETPMLPRETWQLDCDYIRDCFRENAGLGDPDQTATAREFFESFLNRLSTTLEHRFDEPRTSEKMKSLVETIMIARKSRGGDRSGSKLGGATIAEVLKGLPHDMSVLNPSD